MELRLWVLSLALAAGVGSSAFLGLFQPAKYIAQLRAFPRSTGWGYFLVALATGWFIWNLRQESIADFESLKPILYILFIGVGVGTCLYVTDFIAVRGAAVVMLLLAKLMVDSARWVDSPWRLIIVVWAYLLVAAGMWFTVSPWRLRDLVYWKTATPERVRALSAIRLAFALLLAGLAIFVFRPVETKPAAAIRGKLHMAGVASPTAILPS